MKALVTGASGYLGTALCQQLRAQGHTVTGIGSKQADLRQASSLDRFTEPYDRIFHLAAWTQAGDFCLYHPGEQWIINQQIHTTVLQWWQQRQHQAKMIAIGTSCSYDPNLPLVESNYLTGQPIDSLFTYAMTKRMLYAGMLALRKQYGLKFLHVVPSTLFGPGYHTDGRQMHFIFDLTRKIIRGKLHGETVRLWGDGHQRRELVLVEDFVRCILALDQTVEGQTVNIGAGQDHSIRAFAGMICQHLGYDESKIEYDTSKYVGAKAKMLDVAKLRTLLPDVHLTPMDQGMRKTIDWFWEHRDLLLGDRV